MKAIAIPYIIAMILGIVIVGVIGYWFFGLAGKGGGVSLQTECDGLKLSYCQNPFLVTWNTKCGEQPPEPAECNQILGIGGTTGAARTAGKFDVQLTCDNGAINPSTCDTCSDGKTIQAGEQCT